MSMSGQTWSPCQEKLSPTLQITVSSPGSSLSPLSNFADPVPPARATTFMLSPEKVPALFHDQCLDPALAPPVLDTTDDNSRDSSELPGRQFCRRSDLVYQGGLSDAEFVAEAVFRPHIGAQGRNARRAYCNVGLSFPPWPPEGV